MSGIFFPQSVIKWLGALSELRIDVHQEPAELERELETLFRRLNRPGDALYRLPIIGINMPGLCFRYRQADGEHYIYVEDLKNHCLAGYTVFNRLIEVSRRADRLLRAPHSKYATRYQRRGIATAIYRWWLKHNYCLITGARQSASANALWHSLGRSYELVYVDLREKNLQFLGHEVNGKTLEDLHTRMILIDTSWTLKHLAEQTGIVMPDVI